MRAPIHSQSRRNRAATSQDGSDQQRGHDDREVPNIVSNVLGSMDRGFFFIRERKEESTEAGDREEGGQRKAEPQCPTAGFSVIHDCSIKWTVLVMLPAVRTAHSSKVSLANPSVYESPTQIQ